MPSGLRVQTLSLKVSVEFNMLPPESMPPATLGSPSNRFITVLNVTFNNIIEKFNYHDILSFHKIIIAKIQTVDPIIENLSHPDDLLVYLDFSKKLFWNIRYFFFELQHYHVNALAPRGGLTLSRSVS